MKGNISRIGFREGQHYSGVFQVQGGLVTDSDLGEQAAIARSRIDQLGSDTAASGVPAHGGIVDLSGAGPKLVAGTVYAEGVRGEVVATKGIPSALSLYQAQQDFPNAPDLPASGQFFVYADLWERTVTYLEDPLVADPGFHGAETAFRQRTTAQIKYAPLDQLGSLGDDDGPIPRRGGGLLSATPIDPQVIADDCDPCADTVAAAQVVANALFRIEVVQVHGSAQAPDRIVLAWSAANGAPVAPRSVNAEDFERSGSVYEAFSPVTEMHLGVHFANESIARSAFIAAVADVPDPPKGPDGKEWPFLRRWDGKAEVDFIAGTATVAGTGGAAVSGRSVTITTGMLTAKVDFTGKAVVAGDYWLVETRRFAAEPIRVVSDVPLGIAHHYCPLLRITDGKVEALSDAERRRLSFPVLPDVPASHVSFDNPCPDMFEGAENVQDALAALCGLDASKIRFDPAGCGRLYDQVTNVQDALDNLCKVDFGIERYLRLMQDWGVVCGVIPRRASATEVGWGGGAILDRSGTLGDVAETTIPIAKIVDSDGFLFASRDAFAAALRSGDACLALAVDTGGLIKPFLAPKDRAFGPSEASFTALFTKCRDARPWYDFKADYAAVAEASKPALDKVIYSAASPNLAGSQKLSAAEAQVASKYTGGLIGRYKQHLGDDPLASSLDSKIADLQAQIRPQDASGSLRDSLALKLNANIYGVIRETEEQRVRRCLCDALLPRCPELGDRPFLVPIACVSGSVDGQDVIVDEVCAYCCRKQALSWRTVQYFIAETRAQIAGDLEDYCCHPKTGSRPGMKIPDYLFKTMLRPDFTPQVLTDNLNRSLSILAGDSVPTEYRIRPDISQLGIDAATGALAGNGVDVVDTIPAGDDDAVAKLRAVSSIDPGQLGPGDRSVSPGDKVALIVENGIAVDYVKVAAGSGKDLFEPSSGGASADVDFKAKADAALASFGTDLAAKVADLQTTEADLTGALDQRRDEIVAATKDLATLGETRAGIAAQIEGLSSDLTRLQGQREQLMLDVNSASGALDQVKTVHDNVTQQIAAARAELAEIVAFQAKTLDDAKAQRDAVVKSIRSEIPVNSVVGTETDFANVLVSKGVTNVGGLAGMSDGDLASAAKAAGVTLATAKTIKGAAISKLTGPIT